MEVQRHTDIPEQKLVNEKVIELARELNIPLIATNDVHYLKKEDNEAQDILLCLQNKKKVDDNDRMNMMEFDCSVRSSKEMSEVFVDIPESIENTLKIAERCNVEIELGNIQLPYFTVPGGDNIGYLRKLCEEGLVKRYGKTYSEIEPEIKERMDYELSVVDKMGFPSSNRHFSLSVGVPTDRNLFGPINVRKDAKFIFPVFIEPGAAPSIGFRRVASFHVRLSVGVPTDRNLFGPILVRKDAKFIFPFF